MAAPAQLSDDQAAVYDRQLRVWGVEVQKRLSNAKVLIVGGDGLAAEIAKNIVLAGVGNVALLDNTPSTSSSPGNFLITVDADPHSTVAEAGARVLQSMNPLISVTALPGDTPDTSTLSQYDLVIATGQPLSATAALDAECNKAGTRLFAGSVRGPNSYVFANLRNHTYLEKNKPGEKELKYAGFDNCMRNSQSKVNARTHPLFTVLKACYEAEVKLGRPLVASQDDLSAAQAVLAEVTATSGVSSGGASDAAQGELLMSWVMDSGLELAPVSAVLGGVVANNIIRAVSHVDAPVHNFFFYSLFDGMGVIESLVGQ